MCSGCKPIFPNLPSDSDADTQFSITVNVLVADGITNTVRGLIDVLLLVITAVEDILFWFIELILKGAVTCVFSALIEALLDLIKFAIEKTTEAINDIIKPVVTDVGSLVEDSTEALSKVTGFLNGAMSFLGTPPEIPDLGSITTEMDKLSNVSINPATVLQGIGDIQSAVNFSTIQREAEFVIGMPFEVIKLLLNESFGNWTMDSSVFPVASKESLTFCTGNDSLTDFFDALFTILKNAKIIVSIVLVILALLAALLMGWWEAKRYKKTVARSDIFRDREPMDAAYVAARPLTARTGLWLSTKTFKDPQRQMLVRWCIAYSTSLPALFLLSLSATAAFSVICQFLILQALQRETPGLTAEVGGFAANVVGSLKEASARWADESNAAVQEVQDGINNHVLGYARNATGAVSNALSLFENKTQEVLREAFGASGLYSFIDGVADCILLDRVEEARKGLLWVHDHTQVQFPLLPADLFSLGINSSNGDDDTSGSGNSSSSLAGLLASSGNSTADEITGAVAKVLGAMQSGMVQEGLIGLVLLLVYLLYVTLAAAHAALRMCCLRERGRATDQRQDSFSHESQMDDDEPRQGTMGAAGHRGVVPNEKDMSPRSMSASEFSRFDMERVLAGDECDRSMVEQGMPALRVEKRSVSDEHRGDASGEGTSRHPDEDIAQALRDLRAVDNVHVDAERQSLTSRRRHFWAEDGYI